MVKVKGVKKRGGMTLIELLAVISIIAILFTMMIPQLSTGFEKARSVGVQNDFHSYETAIITYMMEEKGEKKEEELNEYLDKELKFKNGISEKKNPYKEPYELTISTRNKIVINTYNNEKEVELRLSVSDEEGEVVSTTFGFEAIKKGYCEIADNESDFEFEIIRGDLELVAYKGNNKEIIIPCKHNGQTLNSIRSEAFYNKGIEYVVIPDTVTWIGDASFAENNLVSVELPSRLETVEQSAFYGNNLRKIIMPESLVNIKPYAFYENEIEELIFNEKIKIIGEEAFAKNRIGHLKIPNSLEQMKDGVFSDNKISDLKIGSSIKIIPDRAFENNNLKTIEIPINITDIGGYAFAQNNIQHIEIPDNVDWIGSNAFSNNPLLTYKISDSTWVEDNVFGTAIRAY